MNILAMIKDKWELNSEGLGTKDIDKLFEIIELQQKELNRLSIVEQAYEGMKKAL